MESLRERSKAKRRAAIQRAGMTLFAERGYDGATIADIADLAEVSPRTVTLYFPSKLEVALSVSNDIASRLGEAFAAHPDLGFTQVIDRWLTGEAQTNPDLVNLVTAMYETNPALRGAASTGLTDAGNVVKGAIITETGLTASNPMINFALVTASAALIEYLNQSANAATTATKPSNYIDQASFIRYLKALLDAVTKH